MFEHTSGLPDAYDRAAGRNDLQGVVFGGERRFLQGAELNEMQTIIRGRHDRLGRLIARDGDRVERGDASVDRDAATVLLTDGKIYASGDVLPVAATTLTGVPMTGSLQIGVWLTRSYTTHEDDPSLLGLVAGSLAEGEPGAARESVALAWGLNTDDANGREFYSVYLLQDGTLLDQTKPPALDGMMQAIATYDRVHGHYVVSGCRVTYLGENAGNQTFAVEEGEANINGFKRTRYASLRHQEPVLFDVTAVPGETHAITGSGAITLNLAMTPIHQVGSVLLTKQKTVTLTRGSTANGIDALPDNSVTSVVSVTQSSTTFAASTDYILTGNSIDWAPVGAEPAIGSTYNVTYRYRDSVTPTNITDTSITVTGGVSGGEAIVAYTYKLPRIDVLGLNESGASVYVKGVSALSNPRAPIAPANVLPLCQIYQTWSGAPMVTNDGVRSVPYAEMWRFFNRLVDHDRLIQLERLKSGIDAREPVAKKGMFVDPFTSDFYRDAGSAQTAAVGEGMLQLPIAVTFYMATLTAPVTLDYVEEIVARQELKTACEKINPYANFNPLPGKMALTPAADFWTETQTEWASDRTVEFNAGVRWDGGPLETVSSSTAVVDNRLEQAEFLRTISVAYVVSGFGAGEQLQKLTFDGIDITPTPVKVANSAGAVSGTFTIPASVPAGSKVVKATGAGGTTAQALFTGQGTIDVDVMRRTTTITRWAAGVIEPPAPVVQEEWINAAWIDHDPQAQLFMLAETRQIIGVDFHLCKLGSLNNHIIVNQVSTDNGYPTADVQAEAFVSMTGAALGWKPARYNLPLTTSFDRDHGFVIKTDDNEHSISLAGLGGFDAEHQQYVTAHPYTTGVRFSSVNARTWTAHQSEALAFKLVAARYTATTKTVTLGSFALSNASDLQVRAAVELPSSACSVVFEVVRANGTIYRLLPGQVLQLNEFITETVQLRAVLTGTAKLSPILYAPIQLLAGRIATSGTYITRAFNLGSAVTLTSYLKAFLPASATVAMHYSVDGGGWTSLPLAATEQLSFNQWSERKFTKAALTGTQVRLRITVTGGPAARVVVGDFGAAVM